MTGPARASLLVPLAGEVVAPRFDAATEVLIARARKGRLVGEPRIVLLPGPSADALCSLVLEEGITDVACGGIEDAHYQYLAWKKVRVVDRVIGSWEGVLRLFLRDALRPGTVVREPPPARARDAAAGGGPPEEP
ncbi:MAG TPA: hypothetical protein VFL83_08645 [Anaeromyxobacter sp.]|nr:hypothetical protein [Anaeromyxobacter sp.]